MSQHSMTQSFRAPRRGMSEADCRAFLEAEKEECVPVLGGDLPSHPVSQLLAQRVQYQYLSRGLGLHYVLPDLINGSCECSFRSASVNSGGVSCTYPLSKCMFKVQQARHVCEARTNHLERQRCCVPRCLCSLLWMMIAGVVLGGGGRSGARGDQTVPQRPDAGSAATEQGAHVRAGARGSEGTVQDQVPGH